MNYKERYLYVDPIMIERKSPAYRRRAVAGPRG